MTPWHAVALVALCLSLFELALWVALLLVVRKLAVQARPMLAMFAPPPLAPPGTVPVDPADVIVVGMVSAYREGRLVRGAIDSLLEVELDALYVFEGPAGDPLPDDVPASDLPGVVPTRLCKQLVTHEGRWRTDARKRDAMLQRAKKDFPGVAWAVVVDADEVLVNGRYLRDRLQSILWQDEARGASIATPDNPPMARWPLHLVEHEGSMSLITARVFRLDLLRSIDHSSSVVTNVAGIQDGWGNYAAVAAVWLERWLAAVDAGKMIAWPPLPAEPFLVHRSNLRHPKRAGLRMSEQEGVEFAKAQALEGLLE